MANGLLIKTRHRITRKRCNSVTEMTGQAELTFPGRASPDKPAQVTNSLSLKPFGFSLLLTLLVFASYPSVILGWQTFVFRDFGLFSYPNAFFQRECFWRGELPFWNPFNNCGVPFLAQWNTMALYPPALIYLLLPLQWSLSFFCLVHVLWGGLGMYLLARRWTNHSLGAAVAGIIFSFNGLTSNFLMWPSHVATFSWLPWVLWLAPDGWRKGGRSMAWVVSAATLQILAGGPETIFFTWLLLVLLAAGEWVKRKHLEKAGRPEPKSLLTWNRNDTRFVGRFLAMGCSTLALSAVQLLPFLTLLSHSQRDAAYSSTSHDWAMPFWGWANFLVPLFRTWPTAQGVYFQNGQYWTSSYYAGVGAVFLGLVAVRRLPEWRVRLVAFTLFVGLILAWGNTSALFTVLQACVPGLGFVRYPVKFVILVLALVPLLAAFGIKAMGEKKPRFFEWGCSIVLLVLILIIIAVEYNTRGSLWTATLGNGLARCLFLLLTVSLLPLALNASFRYQRLFGRVLLVVFWADLRTHVPNQNLTVNPAVYSSACTTPRENHNRADAGLGSRVFISPATRESLAYNSLADPALNLRRNRSVARANINILDAVPQIDGFFSLLPRESFEINNFLYSRSESEPAALLDFMSVSEVTGPGPGCGWITRPTALPMITAGQSPIFADAPATFEAVSKLRADLRSIVYLAGEARDKVSATAQPAARTLNPRVENHKITVQTEAPGPCMVVLSQTYYPGWKVYVDGKVTRLWQANYAFQAVEVPGGNHRLEFVYEDRSFLLGLFLSGLGLIFVLYLACRPAQPNNVWLTSLP
jgi:hypothetical protein